MSLATDRYCPACGSDLRGEPVPEKSREDYGGITHFRRVIAVYSWEQDRTVAWRCPDCDHEEKREW